MLGSWRSLNAGDRKEADMISHGAIGHCADGCHRYCGGETVDRADGTLVYCECRCHGRVRADQDPDQLTCPDCEKVTSDGEYCGECLSERSEYYHPDSDEGGQG